MSRAFNLLNSSSRVGFSVCPRMIGTPSLGPLLNILSEHQWNPLWSNNLVFTLPPCTVLAAQGIGHLKKQINSSSRLRASALCEYLVYTQLLRVPDRLGCLFLWWSPQIHLRFMTRRQPCPELGHYCAFPGRCPCWRHLPVPNILASSIL